MFVGIHAMLAMQTKTPELAVSEQEAKDFTKAAQNVMRHYSVQTTQKTLDWIAFVGVTAGIYGTRIFAISVRKQAEKPASGEAFGQVVKFTGANRRAAAPEPEQPAAPVQPIFTPSTPMGEFEDGSGF